MKGRDDCLPACSGLCLGRGKVRREAYDIRSKSLRVSYSMYTSHMYTAWLIPLGLHSRSVRNLPGVKSEIGVSGHWGTKRVNLMRMFMLDGWPLERRAFRVLIFSL